MMKGLWLPCVLCLGAACIRTPSILHPDHSELIKRDAQDAAGGFIVVPVPEPAEKPFHVIVTARDASGATVPATAAELDNLRDALAATVKIIYGAEFRAHVRADSSWLAAVDNSERLPGEILSRFYPAYIPRQFSIVINRVNASGERADTGFEPPVITTYDFVIDEWNSPATRPTLINTLAHEMTHLIPQQRGNSSQYAFVDRLFSLRPCKQADLVSYKTGNIAECTAREPGEDFTQCMNAAHARMKRRLWAICPGYPKMVSHQ